MSFYQLAFNRRPMFPQQPPMVPNMPNPNLQRPNYNPFYSYGQRQHQAGITHSSMYHPYGQQQTGNVYPPQGSYPPQSMVYGAQRGIGFGSNPVPDSFLGNNNGEKSELLKG